MPVHVDAEPHVSLQMAPSSHWKVQPPPAQSFAHCEPLLQSTMQSPPAQDASQTAPDSQWIVQCPPAQVGVHVPEAQVKSHPPAAQAGEHALASVAAVHWHPASAVACAPQAGRGAASAGGASALASRGAQSAWKLVWSRMAAHWASSAAASAFWQFWVSTGFLHELHRSPSCVHGSWSVDGDRLPHAAAATATKPAGARKRGRGKPWKSRSLSVLTPVCLV